VASLLPRKPAPATRQPSSLPHTAGGGGCSGRSTTHRPYLMAPVCLAQPVLAARGLHRRAVQPAARRAPAPRARRHDREDSQDDDDEQRQSRGACSSVGPACLARHVIRVGLPFNSSIQASVSSRQELCSAPSLDTGCGEQVGLAQLNSRNEGSQFNG